MESAKPTSGKPADPLRQVVAWLIAGHSAADVIDALKETFPKAKAQPLIVKAMKQLAEEGADADEDAIRGFALAGTRAIYQKALEVADHQTALRALKQLVELASK